MATNQETEIHSDATGATGGVKSQEMLLNMVPIPVHMECYAWCFAPEGRR